MEFKLQSNLRITNAQAIFKLVEIYEGFRVFQEGNQIRKYIQDEIGEIIQHDCRVLWMVRRDERVELGLNFKGWDFTPVITVAIDGTVSSEDGVNKEGFSEILRGPYVGKTNEGGLKMKTSKSIMAAEEKVNAAEAAVRAAEQEYREAEASLRGALEYLRNTQAERDKFREKPE